MKWDKIIIGAGLYGLYSAWLCGKRGERILVLECDDFAFKRATYANQARVHMGYHYPRSYSTAVKSAQYFNRFVRDYKECILTEFAQRYANSANFSWTNAEQFKKFCLNAGIRCDEISPDKYFQKGKCDGAFITTEYTYDASMLRDIILSDVQQMKNITILYGVSIEQILGQEEYYILVAKIADKTEEFMSSFVLNATYASVNQICRKAGAETFKIKYELCEIILCNVGDELKKVGLTVMDGPFFSIMPFGKTGYHSLTSVTFTPHVTSYDELPTFSCQTKCKEGICTPDKLSNCNECMAKPDSAWTYMAGLARKYMNPSLEFEYEKSLFSMKPILQASEIDDSRPTVIRNHTKKPTFVSVLSGKINTVYDLDEVLLNE